MTEIIFIQTNGEQRKVHAEEDMSLMVAAVDNDIIGIEALCNGCCSCGTCHVVLTQHDLAKVTPPYSGELQVLNSLANAESGSRLSCQLIVTPALAGITVRIKE